MKYLMLLTLVATTAQAAGSITVIVDGETYACSKDGSGGGILCECALRKNESRKDYYFEVYKKGQKIYGSSEGTNTVSPQDQMLVCKSHIVSMSECYR